jgi:Ca-activated chloride channel family protein
MLAALLLLILIGCNERITKSTTTYSKPQDQELIIQEATGVKAEERSEISSLEYSMIKEPKVEKPVSAEEYDNIVDNKFLSALQNPLSTFSTDVDEASYSNIRRFIQNGTLPPAGAVRIEEMINYFDYEYPQPAGDAPFSVVTEIAECPWNIQHRLVHIGLQGKEVPVHDLPSANIVFLIDVSGSMDEPNKLPLVKSSMKILTDKLRENDKVAIVVYAGNAGLVLPSTNGMDKVRIKQAIEDLEAGGSTAGGEGISLAYDIARKNFIDNANNRVILATDGDFNVGISSDDELIRLIEKERQSGIFLSVLGFGVGNYKDSKMQQLANKGNGNHSYIDNISEARKVLVSEFGSTLFTVAKDVKLQIEFNPSKVQAYRLIGYENRLLATEDFNDDTKDAGEIGSGHTVTALYEIIPIGIRSEFIGTIDSLKYQISKKKVEEFSPEIMTIKLRYKNLQEDISKLISTSVRDESRVLGQTSNNFRFSAAVACLGMVLRNSPYKQQSSDQMVLELARGSKGLDTNGYRQEFIKLVETVALLAKNK